MTRIPSWVLILLALGSSTLFVYFSNQQGLFTYLDWDSFQIIVLWFLISILAMTLMIFDDLWDLKKGSSVKKDT